MKLIPAPRALAAIGNGLIALAGGGEGLAG